MNYVCLGCMRGWESASYLECPYDCDDSRAEYVGSSYQVAVCHNEDGCNHAGTRQIVETFSKLALEGGCIERCLSCGSVNHLEILKIITSPLEALAQEGE